MHVKIELPETIAITSRGVEVSLDLSKLSPDIVARLVIHGATQKVADAASGAAKLVSDEVTIEQATESLMTKARDALVAGEWSQRSGGGGVDEETRIARIVVRNAIKAKFGSKSPEWAKFTGLSDAEQIAKLDEIRAANADAFQPAIEAELERRRKAAAEKAKLAKGLDIAI